MFLICVKLNCSKFQSDKLCRKSEVGTDTCKSCTYLDSDSKHSYFTGYIYKQCSLMFNTITQLNMDSTLKLYILYWHSLIDYCSSTPNHHVKIERFLPCGSLKLTHISRTKQIEWTIQIHSHFFLNITFLEFQMDYSGPLCDYSAFIIHVLLPNNRTCSNMNWRYCGVKPSWTELISTHRVKLSIVHLNVLQEYNITLIYVTITKTHFKYNYQEKIVTKYQTFFSFLKNAFKLSNNYQFVIQSEHSQHLELIDITCLNSILMLYDGPGKHLPIFKITTCNNTVRGNLSYFMGILLYYVSDEFKTSMFTIQYKNMPLIMNNIELDTVISIKHNGILTRKGYKCVTVHRNYLLTFRMHTFTGFNTNNCIFGGIVLSTQHPTKESTGLNHGDNKMVTQNPYCIARSGTPLIGSLNEIILPGGRSELIIYGYSDMFDIDLEIHVTETEVIGAINICQFCLMYTENVKLPSRFSVAYFSIECGYYKRHNLHSVWIIGVHRKTLRLQSISENPPSSCIIEIQGHLKQLSRYSMRIAYFAIEPFRLEWTDKKLPDAEISYAKVYIFDIEKGTQSYLHLDKDDENFTITAAKLQYLTVVQYQHSVPNVILTIKVQAVDKCITYTPVVSQRFLLYSSCYFINLNDNIQSKFIIGRGAVSSDYMYQSITFKTDCDNSEVFMQLLIVDVAQVLVQSNYNKQYFYMVVDINLKKNTTESFITPPNANGLLSDIRLQPSTNNCTVMFYIASLRLHHILILQNLRPLQHYLEYRLTVNIYRYRI